MCRLTDKRLKGFSLAEAMIATVVLSIAAAGVLLPFTSGAKIRAEGMHQTLAARLASDLIEEIIRTPFGQIVGTFDGYSELQGQIKDTNDVVFTGSAYTNFSRELSFIYFDVPQQSGSGESGYILATVRVSYSGKPLAIINRLISK